MSASESIGTSAPSSNAPEASDSSTRKNSYHQILKSSAVIGGSSLVNVAVAIVRTKAMAMLLGPAGVGLMGMYSSIADLGQTIAGMGVSSSGVRQLSEAGSSDDSRRIFRTATILTRTAFVLGLSGGLTLVALSHPISELTFGNRQHAFNVALLSLVVFFGVVAGSQGALVQGMRRIGDLAKISVLGGLYATPISIAIVYFFGDAGIAPALIAIGATSAVVSWWFGRKVALPAGAMTPNEIRIEVAELLKLGLAFMASGLLMAGAAYAVRTLVLRKIGLDAAGLYQSAWTLGGLYIGFILQAMGADFYPRLVRLCHDHRESNRVVNEQANVGLLLAGPGVLATITFAPIIVPIFYSASFADAVEVLRWMCLGMALRVITWPIGFIIVAKNARLLFFLSELTWAAVNVGLAWWCVPYFGLAGAGMAFFASCLLHGLLVYPIVRRLSGFRFSEETRRTFLILPPLVALVFFGFQTLPAFLATGLGTIATLLCGYYSIRRLTTLVSSSDMPHFIRQIRKHVPFRHRGARL
jgi:PST family polysaccharide transporter